jgi:hypothetical protein
VAAEVYSEDAEGHDSADNDKSRENIHQHGLLCPYPDPGTGCNHQLNEKFEPCETYHKINSLARVHFVQISQVSFQAPAKRFGIVGDSARLLRLICSRLCTDKQPLFSMTFDRAFSGILRV